MIHYRKTIDIASGRQGEAIARAHEWAALAKDHGITLRVPVVTTGTLGRLCMSADYESMGAREADGAKAGAHPDWVALGAKQNQEVRDGTSPLVPNTVHEEYWRYS